MACASCSVIGAVDWASAAGAAAAPRQRESPHRRWRVHRLCRPLRLREVDAAPHDRGLEEVFRGRDPYRWRSGERGAGREARACDGVPVLRALPAHVGAETSPSASRRCGTPKTEIKRRVAERPRSFRSASCSTAGRGNFPVASASGSRSGARSCANRKSFSSTSRFPTSTRNSAYRCGSRSRNCTGARRDNDLRDPRPGRGDDACRPDRGPAVRRIEQVGTPIDLYDRPANLFVAGFIGSPAHEFHRRRDHGGRGRAGDVPRPLRHQADAATDRCASARRWNRDAGCPA